MSHPPPTPAPDGDRPARPDWRAAAVGLACVAAGVGAAAGFLPHQSLWVDEATQLSGLSLGPGEVVRWLAGRADPDLGVPPDRMPPLSYWVGWAWAHLFGLTEGSLRWFGVVCTAAATLLVFRTAYRTWGLPAGAAAGLLFALSPNVATEAVEIRAYPLFLLTSAGVFGALVRLLSDPAGYRPCRLAALVVWGTAAMYTHFYGLVVAGGALLAALVLARARGARPTSVLAAVAVSAVLAAGLAPFALASGRLSEWAPEGDKWIALVRLAYRLFAHPATAVSDLAVGVCLTGAAAALAGAVGGARRRGSEAAAGIGIALAAGLAVVVVANFVQSGFDAARPSYNVWALPGLALGLASGVAAPTAWARRAAQVGVGLLLLAHVYGLGQLVENGPAFAHTPHRPVADLIRRLGPDGVVVIHDASPGPSQVGHLYFPIRYEFNGSVPYYDATDGPDGVRVVPFPGRQGAVDPARLPARYLVVLRARRVWATEVAGQVKSGVPPLGDGPVAEALDRSGRWARVEDDRFGSFVVVDATVFRPTGASPGGP